MAVLRVKNWFEETKNKVRKKKELAEEKIFGGDEVYLDIFAVYSLFMLYFYLNWVGTGPHIPYDALWKIVEPFHNIIGMEWSLEIFKMGWDTAGRQFFLTPILLITGLSPVVLKIIATAVYALVGPLLYLTVKEKFDFYTGYSIALIFITFRLFQKWRTSDMYIFFFLTFLFLYIYVRWEDSGDDFYIFAMAFIAGFSPYVMKITFYPIIALVIATILLKRKSLYNVSGSTYFKAGLLFLLGASPILIYSIPQGFSNLYPGWSISNYPGLLEALTIRYDQFQVITAAAHPVAKAELQEGFHLYSILFAIGAFISCLRRRDLVYLLSFGIVFVMSTFTPDAPLPIHQAMVVYPFFLMIIAQNFSELKNFWGLNRLAPFLPLFILFLTLGNMHSYRVHPGSITVDEFQEFQELDVSDTVVTNHRHSYAMTIFDSDVEGRILATDDWKFNFFVDRNDRITLDEALEGYRDSNYTLILIDEGPCKELFYGAKRCGYNTSTIIEKGDLDRENAETFSGPRERRTYHVFN